VPDKVVDCGFEYETKRGDWIPEDDDRVRRWLIRALIKVRANNSPTFHWSSLQEKEQLEADLEWRILRNGWPLPAKRRKLKSAGRCIFCGRTGLTKEHVWSDWLRQIVPPTLPHGNHFGTVSHRSESKTIVVTELKGKVKPGNLQQKQLKRVCGTCNKGWMSEYVELTKAFVERLATGESVELDSKAQADLAVWVSIAAIMAELLDPRSATIPRNDLRQLFKTRKPLSNWTIFLGRHNTDSWLPLRHVHTSGCFGPKDDLPSEVLLSTPGGHSFHQQTVYSLNGLLVIAFSSSNPELVSAIREYVQSDYLVRIHPCVSQRVAWPCTPFHGESEIKELLWVGLQLLLPEPDK
jgi:hypothetical protein